MAIRPRGHGWQVDVKVDGRRVRRTVATQADALALESGLRATGSEDRRLRPGNRELDVARLLDEYHLDLEARGARPGTLKTTGSVSAALRRVLGGGTSLSSLDPTEYSRERLSEGVSPSTINGGLRVLRAALRLAEENHGVEVPRVRMIKAVKPLPSILTDDELRSLYLAAERAQDTNLTLALRIAATAGLRKQEILHLQWADWTGRELTVTAKAGWVPKSHTERAVPVDTEGVLRAHLDGMKPSWAAAHTWIFRPYRSHERMRDLDSRPAFQAAGLENRPRAGFHMLRRTWASRLAAAGADIETIRQLGGWADLVTVQRYLNTDDERRRRAIGRIS